MALKTKITGEKFDFNTLAEKTWECPRKGLKKTLIDFKYESMKKATEISKCLVQISNVRNLGENESNYLKNVTDNDENEFWIELGTSITPIDRYIEIFLQHMFVGEKSQFSITIKSSSEPVLFVLYYKKLEFIDYLYRLNAKQMYDLSLKFKENGVSMFKKYPRFAQEYFCRSAKFLISFKPFDGLTDAADGVNPKQMKELLENIQLNIAACLIKEKKHYENIIYLTQFVDEIRQDEDKFDIGEQKISDKAIYRRAVAFYNLKQYEKAKEIIEKCNYKENKEFSNLYNKILNGWKLETNEYNSMVKKMFM